MKKLVIRVVVITVAAIIAITAITYLLISLISPVSLAEFYGNIGNYKIAVGFAEKQYEKDGKISSIVLASDYAVKIGDNKAVIKYSELAINDDEFPSYSLESPERTSILLSHYIKAKYSVEGGEVATERAFSCLVGYKSHNVVETLIVEAYGAGDISTLGLINSRLANLDTSSFSDEECAVWYEDLLILKGILGEK